ncbi:MAG: hypothetical protein ACREQX_03485 [Candidatus Binataceae bacterium]
MAWSLHLALSFAIQPNARGVDDEMWMFVNTVQPSATAINPRANTIAHRPDRETNSHFSYPEKSSKGFVNGNFGSRDRLEISNIRREESE